MKLETTSAFKQLYKYNKNLIVLTDEQVKETQRINLETLHDIIDICNSFSINYHLTGGSALGVVRHKGFIPWDDDIDIDMARKDINLFFREFRKKYGKKYWIHSPHKKGVHCIPCYHIRRKGTVFRGCSDPTAEESGISIDILVMENTFDNFILRKLHGLGSMALGLIVSCRRFYLTKDYLLTISSGAEEIQKTFKKKIALGHLFAFFSLERWTLLYEKWNSLCHNEHSKYVVVATGKNHFFRETYLRADFSQTTQGQFEDMEVKIPLKWDKYLTHMFGNYMEIPKEGNREQHVLVEFEINI